MTTLREFIATRQAEISAQMAALRKEDREMKTALAALDGEKPKANRRAAPQRTTYREMTLAVLGRYGGARVESIIGLVKEDFGVDVPKSSMSPLLSKLKAEGAVTLDQDDKIWRLVRKPPNENGPTAVGPEANAKSDLTASGVHVPSAQPDGA